MDGKLSRPTLLSLDEKRKEFFVYNKWSRTLNRYKI